MRPAGRQSLVDRQVGPKHGGIKIVEVALAGGRGIDRAGGVGDRLIGDGDAGVDDAEAVPLMPWMSWASMVLYGGRMLNTE